MIKVSYANTMKEELIKYIIEKEESRIINIVLNSNDKNFKNLTKEQIKENLKSSQFQIDILNYLKDNEEGKKETFLNNLSIRNILIKMGTEFFRTITANIHVYFEVVKTIELIESNNIKILEELPMLISDDTRFLNEAMFAKRYNQIKKNSTNIEAFKTEITKLIDTSSMKLDKENNQKVFEEEFGSNDLELFDKLNQKIEHVFEIAKNNGVQEDKFDTKEPLKDENFILIKRPIMFDKDKYEGKKDLKSFFDEIRKENLELSKEWGESSNPYMSQIQVSIDNYTKILNGFDSTTKLYELKEGEVTFFLEQDTINKNGKNVKNNFKFDFNPKNGKLNKTKIRKKEINELIKEKEETNNIDFNTILSTLIEKTGYSRSDFTHSSEHLIYEVEQEAIINLPSQDGVNVNTILNIKEKSFLNEDGSINISNLKYELEKRATNDFKILVGSAGTGKSVYLSILENLEKFKNKEEIEEDFEFILKYDNGNKYIVKQNLNKPFDLEVKREKQTKQRKEKTTIKSPK